MQEKCRHRYNCHHEQGRVEHTLRYLFGDADAVATKTGGRKRVVTSKIVQLASKVWKSKVIVEMRVLDESMLCWRTKL